MLSLSHSLITPLPLQGWEAAYIQELPLHLPIPGGAMWLQSSPIQHTQSTYWCRHSSRQSRPSHDTIQKLGRWRSSAYQAYIRHPLTHHLTQEQWPHSNSYTSCMYPCIVPYSTNLKPYPNRQPFTWATPSGLLPGDSHQTMTSVLVCDTGQPNCDQRHPLVPVGPVVRGTAATCLAAAVACPHYGPNTTTILSMGQGVHLNQPVRAIRWH